ncbi:GTPase-activator protein for Ras-like GTPase [Carpediemonas membranifera]|uniref:GTPase-activator protein for Ras-like GTPase n=1 Tax=Carpediemonas membranifera TaxID=201153 RepID=A0A8J6BED3_9EUKA|nr:GTPase-activator protein for Ras-like GTPase [Carpediemonas membranifera]|eukprot:KAG9395712.1 GTPase-activator protein for Ras-like GTPase [Carpediemonas membranifera]
MLRVFSSQLNSILSQNPVPLELEHNRVVGTNADASNYANAMLSLVQDSVSAVLEELETLYKTYSHSVDLIQAFLAQTMTSAIDLNSRVGGTPLPSKDITFIVSVAEEFAAISNEPHLRHIAANLIHSLSRDYFATLIDLLLPQTLAQDADPATVSINCHLLGALEYTGPRVSALFTALTPLSEPATFRAIVSPISRKAIATLVYSAVLGWAHALGRQFVVLATSEGRMRGDPDLLCVTLFQWAEDTTHKHPQTLMALYRAIAAGLVCCPDIMLAVFLQPARAAQEYPVLFSYCQRLRESILPQTFDARFASFAAAAVIDLVGLSTLVDKGDICVLRHIVPDLQPYVEKLLIADQLELSPDDTRAYFLASFRINPLETIKRLTNLLHARTHPMVVPLIQAFGDATSPEMPFHPTLGSVREMLAPLVFDLLKEDLESVVDMIDTKKILPAPTDLTIALCTLFSLDPLLVRFIPDAHTPVLGSLLGVALCQAITTIKSVDVCCSGVANVFRTALDSTSDQFAFVTSTLERVGQAMTMNLIHCPPLTQRTVLDTAVQLITDSIDALKANADSAADWGRVASTLARASAALECGMVLLTISPDANARQQARTALAFLLEFWAIIPSGVAKTHTITGSYLIYKRLAAISGDNDVFETIGVLRSTVANVGGIRMACESAYALFAADPAGKSPLAGDSLAMTLAFSAVGLGGGVTVNLLTPSILPVDTTAPGLIELAVSALGSHDEAIRTRARSAVVNALSPLLYVRFVGVLTNALAASRAVGGAEIEAILADISQTVLDIVSFNESATLALPDFDGILIALVQQTDRLTAQNRGSRLLTIVPELISVMFSRSTSVSFRQPHRTRHILLEIVRKWIRLDPSSVSPALTLLYDGLIVSDQDLATHYNALLPLATAYPDVARACMVGLLVSNPTAISFIVRQTQGDSVISRGVAMAAITKLLDSDESLTAAIAEETKVPPTDLIRDALFMEPIDGLLGQLAKTTGQSEGDDVAKALLRLCPSHETAIDVVSSFVEAEINEMADATSVLRQNTFPAKLLAQYLRLTALEYLEDTLKPVIADIIRLGATDLELDRSRVSSDITGVESEAVIAALIEDNVQRLIDVSRGVLKAIFAAVDAMPLGPRIVCRKLQDALERRFPGTKVSATGAVLFLKFIAPSIAAPDAYQIVQSVPVSARRNLLHVSKVVIKVGNGMLFHEAGRSNEVMDGVNPLITELMGSRGQYLGQIIDVADKMDDLTNLDPISVNEDEIENASARIHRSIVEKSGVMATTLAATHADSVEALESLLDNLGPPPEIIKKVRAINSGSIASPHLDEFKRHSDNIDPALLEAASAVFVQSGQSAERRPLFWWRGEHYSAELDHTAILRHMIDIAQPFWTLPFEVVIDCTHAQRVPTAWLMRLFAVVPPEARENLKALHVLRPGTDFDSSLRSLAKTLSQADIRKIRVYTSASMIRKALGEKAQPMPLTARSLELDARILHSFDLGVPKSRHDATLSISAKDLIITMHGATPQTTRVDAFALADVTVAVDGETIFVSEASAVCPAVRLTGPVASVEQVSAICQECIHQARVDAPVAVVGEETRQAVLPARMLVVGFASMFSADIVARSAAYTLVHAVLTKMHPIAGHKSVAKGMFVASSGSSVVSVSPLPYPTVIAVVSQLGQALPALTVDMCVLAMELAPSMPAELVMPALQFVPHIISIVAATMPERIPEIVSAGLALTRALPGQRVLLAQVVWRQLAMYAGAAPDVVESIIGVVLESLEKDPESHEDVGLALLAMVGEAESMAPCVDAVVRRGIDKAQSARPADAHPYLSLIHQLAFDCINLDASLPPVLHVLALTVGLPETASVAYDTVRAVSHSLIAQASSPDLEQIHAELTSPSLAESFLHPEPGAAMDVLLPVLVRLAIVAANTSAKLAQTRSEWFKMASHLAFAPASAPALASTRGRALCLVGLLHSPMSAVKICHETVLKVATPDPSPVMHEALSSLAIVVSNMALGSEANAEHIRTLFWLSAFCLLTRPDWKAANNLMLAILDPKALSVSGHPFSSLAAVKPKSMTPDEASVASMMGISPAGWPLWSLVRLMLPVLLQFDSNTVATSMLREMHSRFLTQTDLTTPLVIAYLAFTGDTISLETSRGQAGVTVSVTDSIWSHIGSTTVDAVLGVSLLAEILTGAATKPCPAAYETIRRVLGIITVCPNEGILSAVRHSLVPTLQTLACDEAWVDYRLSDLVLPVMFSVNSAAEDPACLLDADEIAATKNPIRYDPVSDEIWPRVRDVLLCLEH